MGCQELSHQQVMSYLVVGGDFYTGHKFRSVRLYQFTAALTNHECQPHVDSDNATTSADLCTHDREEENITLNTSPGEVKLTSDFLDYRFHLVNTAFELMNMWEFMEDSTKVSKRTSSGGSLGEGDASEVDQDGDQPREHAWRRFHCFNFSSDEHPEFDTHGIRLHSARVVPVLLGDNIPRKDINKEAFCWLMLLLFKPW
jgi:hypothetical protein